MDFKAQRVDRSIFESPPAQNRSARWAYVLSTRTFFGNRWARLDAVKLLAPWADRFAFIFRAPTKDSLTATNTHKN